MKMSFKLYDRVIEKYKELSVQVKASIWFIVCNILQKALALLATPIFTRIMTQEQYGVYSQYTSWHGILVIFATLNLFIGVYSKGIVEFKQDAEAFTSSLLTLTSVITVILFVIYLLFIDFWTSVLDMSPVLMVAMFVDILVWSAFEFWSVKQRFIYHYKKLVVLTILMTIFTLLFGVIGVLVSEWKVEARVISEVIVRVAIAAIIYVNIIKQGKCGYNKKYWIYALSFNLPLIPHFLSNLVLGQADRIMIGKLVGDASVAIYSIAYTISMMMVIIVNAINNSYTPYIYEKLELNEVENIRKSVYPVIVIIAVLCMCTTIFAPELILVFAGKTYMEAVDMIPIIAISVFFIYLYSLFSNVEYFYKKTKGIAVATTIAAILNIVLNMIFIPIFGYKVAAVTTLVCYIFLAIMHYIMYLKIVKNEMKNQYVFDGKFIIKISVALLLGSFIMMYIYEYIIIRYILFFVIAIMCYIFRDKLIAVFRK